MKNNEVNHNSLIMVLGVISSLFSFTSASEPTVLSSNDTDIPSATYDSIPEFGGPSSVGVQIKSKPKDDSTQTIQSYYQFKDKIKEEYGLAFGVDYHMLYQAASKSLGEDQAAGGIIRFYGTWELVGRDSEDKGALVFKVESRHDLGTKIVPQSLGSEVGYAGLTAVPYSNAGSLLTNLYWQQSFMKNRVAFVAGIVDATDYLNVYGLVNPWSDFSNLAFSTDPTIPVPNQGLGAALRVMVTDKLYLLAGFADANGDPSDIGDNFKSFFNEHEYFKHLEFGWISSFENRFEDNIHLTLWQVDERKEAQVPDGWGAAFSFSRRIKEKWLPFFRAAYADGGGGSILERSVSTGIGYYPNVKGDVLGIGLNWGRPSQETYGGKLDDQYTAELYYRFELSPHLTLTPDLQYIIHPALNPCEDKVWVLGLGAKISF